MTKNKRKPLCFLLLGAMLLPLFGCASANVREGTVVSGSIILLNEREDHVAQYGASAELSEAAVDFAVELLKNSAAEGENTVLSPFSALTALALTANGAAGETRTQTEAVLGAPTQQWNAWFATLMPSQSLLSANSVWLRENKGLNVETDFLYTASDCYDAEVYRALFDAETCEYINAWVTEHTDGQIEKLLDGIQENTMLYLLNALSFKAEWEDPFRANNVKQGEFIASDGSVQPVTLMYGTQSRYLADESAEGFIKEYADGRYSFVALLPKQGVSAEEYLQTLTGERLRALLDGETKAHLSVAIPKLTVETDLLLNDALRAMGMTDAFDEGTADLTALGQYRGGRLYVGQVTHKTLLSLDERGTTAGAVTSVEIPTRTAGIGKELLLNRPFLLAIWDNEGDMPVFFGIINRVDG